MEIKISLEAIKNDLFENLDKALKNTYSKLDSAQQITVKKQILGLKDEQYSLELKILQLTSVLENFDKKEVEEPVVKPKKVLDEEDVVSEENTETIDL